MPDLYFELHPDGPYTADYGTSTPAAGGISLAVPAVLRPVPTLEATHTWAGGLQLHDFRELGTEVSWRLRCRSISLGSPPAVVLPADTRVGGTGAFGRRGSVGGRTATYAGAIQAVDAAALREASAAVLAIGWDVDQDSTVTIEQNDSAWTYSGRALPNVQDNPSLPLSAVPTPYQAEFTVAVQMNDPRIYAIGEYTDAAVVEGPELGSAATLPWPRLPVILRPAAPPVATGTVDILGRLATGITLRVHGPRSAITITDVTRDVHLVLDLDIAAGAWVDIDLRNARITSSTGEDFTTSVRWPDSTWWAARARDVRPGPLTLRVASETAGADAHVDVIHSPAFP